jgi:hypothetical protein
MKEGKKGEVEDRKIHRERRKNMQRKEYKNYKYIEISNNASLLYSLSPLRFVLSQCRPKPISLSS